MTRPLAALAAIALGFGCYSTGRVRFADHPELAGIRLASTADADAYEEISLVHSKVRGFRGCSELVVEALQNLASDSEALGGEVVRDVKFRGRWHWMGRTVCRTTPIGVSAEVRGFAARPRPVSVEPVSGEPAPVEPGEEVAPLEVAAIELPPDPPPFGSGSEAECLAWQAYMESELDTQAEEIRAQLVTARAERPDSPVVDDAWRSLDAQAASRLRFIETNSEACQAAARGD
ncbi:MAG: hypothetical protein OEP95_09580 [Myxococcales bacterium]|nr:hypothetical protein [Myxococcales bacterium]